VECTTSEQHYTGSYPSHTEASVHFDKTQHLHDEIKYHANSDM